MNSYNPKSNSLKPINQITMMKSDQWWIVTVLAICATLVQISRADDRILNLPGQPAVSFKQHGGYISVDKLQRRALFYYFVEAELNTDSKPLLLWLSGGPGCSSLGFGAFSEHGPFRPSGENLIRNDYSWNKEANMLYLESPAGVGFSYSANTSFYDYINDTITGNVLLLAQDNLIFLKQWFLKYPKYKNRDFYVAGDSYAGHYVPQLAELIVKSGLKFNLKGIAMGNPLLEFETDIKAQGDYYWTHGLISDSTYKLMNSICNNTQLWRETIKGSLSPPCTEINTTLSKEMPASLDPFHVTSDICISSSSSASNPNPNPPSGIDVCVEEKTAIYLQREDVRKAFHGKLVGVTKWEMCNEKMNYDFRNFEIPTIDAVGSLVRSGIRVLIYSGDQDSRVPFTGSRVLVDGLANQLNLNTTVPYTPWFLDKQVGGWTQVYGDNMLTFATIRGGGHLAPLASPKRSFALFSDFLARKPPPQV